MALKQNMITIYTDQDGLIRRLLLNGIEIKEFADLHTHMDPADRTSLTLTILGDVVIMRDPAISGELWAAEGGWS